MIYKKLNGKDVSVVGYGAWALGGVGWDIIREEANRSLEVSYNLGINFFDTAPVYGFGMSEEKIGDVLNSVRKNIFIATKCGLIWDENKNVSKLLSRDSVLKEIELSLKRLRTDYIDLYQVHWYDDKTTFKEIFSTLNNLKRQGIIKEIGICNFNKSQIKKALEYSEIVSVQDQYNLLQRKVEKNILPFCKENNIAFIAYSALAQGFLTGKIYSSFKLKNKDAREFNPIFIDRKKFKKTLEFVNALPKPASHTAIKFLLNNPTVTTVLMSMTKIKHIKENLRALENLSS